MNPDRNKGGMTVNGLLLLGLFCYTAIPVVMLAIVGIFAAPQIPSGANTTFAVIVIVCVTAIIFGIPTIGYVIQRKVKDRLLVLVDICRDYAGGDHTIRATVNGDDELGMLAVSLNTLLDSQSLSQGGGLGSGGSDAAALQGQIEKLLQEVSAVGDGDLRVQAEVTPDTLGVLADSFNYMIEELAKVVGRVQATAVQVTNAASRILEGSEDLAQASEVQVSQISQTTEAVEALAIFIQNVARNAQSSVEVAHEALRSAESGQKSVRQTIDGMMLIRENVQETSKKIKRLGERSNEISEIVRIIEDIADQTNLLALNAAIQSAMAGEHGRGFAVVADEIRLLAERSTESTKRIDTLVKSIQGDTYDAVVAMEDSTQEVVKGSQLADEAGRALNSIYGTVERQALMIENIANSANEQTSVSEAVAVAMSQISEITRRANVSTQEAAASVSYLADLTEQLRSSVSTFRLPDNANEAGGVFSSMTSVTELSNGNNSQYFSPALASGEDNNWNQNFAGNFPPLPEPGNSGSLVALSSRGRQYALNNQQDFGAFDNQQGFSSDFAFDGQHDFGSGQFDGQDFGNGQFGGQQVFGNGSFDSQPGFGGPPSFGGPQSFGNSSFENQPGFGGPPSFGGQQGFGEVGGFEHQQGFSGFQFDNTPGGFGNPSQSGFPDPNQFPHTPSQAQNSGQFPHQQGPQGQGGQSQAGRQRWQRGPQPDQGQSQYSQDQTQYPNNGQFGH